jgi:preprotein translocase subunit SecF
MQFFSNTKIDFLGMRKIAYLFSGVLILAGVISMIIHGGPHYNIDFTGGTLLHLKFNDNIQIETLRTSLTERGYGDSEIKHFGSEQDIVIRLSSEHSAEEMSTKVEQIIRETLPENTFIVQRVEKVGPKVGKELIAKAIEAVLVALVLILLYVMVRFEFRFAVGAIVATFHDVLVTLGIFSLLDIEISSPLIAAILTIIGYSLNDTVVVFDRIRENMKVKQRDIGGLTALMNRSLNETLSRTIITSLTTLFVVVILFFFGGEVLRSFSFALILGIVFGTYSTLFIASPIVLEMQAKKISSK